MSIINLTRHDVVIISEDGVKTVFEKSGMEARVNTKLTPTSTDAGCAVMKRSVTEVVITGSSEATTPVTGYIVSAQVVDAIKADSLLSDGVDIYTVGETIREIKPDGTTVISGAKYLVLN